MAKKKTHAKAPKYQSFRLHGKHNMQAVCFYVAFDLVISLIVGVILQSQITQALAFH
jgi:hypothetical protein